MSNQPRSTGVILLAAGGSTRMGTPKQRLDFGGKPMLRHTAEIACAAECGPVVVVLGAQEAAMRPILEGLPVKLAVNARWEEGMGTSIQAGLAALESEPVTGAILTLADQPYVTAHTLRDLAERHFATGKAIVAARYSGTVGVPVFFARAAFPLLESLAPGQGCKSVILGHIRDALLVDCPEAAIDIDTPEDYARASAS